MELVIESTGRIRCLYDEDIDLRELGRLSIERGSHVEPTADGQWIADLGLPGINGPRLGPFPCRSDALAAERQWLEQNWLLAAR